MTREATEKLIKHYYRAFNDKKFNEMMACLSDDVIHDTNQGERSVGRDVFVSFMKDMDAYYDERLDNFSILASENGERASAEFICNGIYKKSSTGLPAARGQKYVLPVGCFFEVKNGKISRVTNYYNLQDWLKQVQ